MANGCMVYERPGIRVSVYESKRQPFFVRGKRYANIDTFAYHRRVVASPQRYPCFDESDYLYEDRYFRYYFYLDTAKQAREARQGMKAQYDHPFSFMLPSLSFHPVNDYEWNAYCKLPARTTVYVDDGQDYLLVVERD